MIGMFSALVGGAIWLWFATYLKLPVSSTHSIGKKHIIIINN